MQEMGMASVISFIKEQRLQWLEHVLQRGEDDVS